MFPINNLREAVDTAKRLLNTEKLDKQLTGQASNTSSFMKLRDAIHSSQKVSIKPQDLETMTTMMYNMSLQQDKAKKPFKPQVYQRRGRGQRQNYNRDRPRNNNRQGQSFVQNRCRNNFGRNGYAYKTLAETTLEIEAGEILIEVIVVIEVNQEKEAQLKEGIVTGNLVILG